MDVELIVLIPLAILLVILIIAVIFLICRYSLFPCQRKSYYNKVNEGIERNGGYPKLPIFKKAAHATLAVQQRQGEQISGYNELSPDRQKNARYRYEAVPGNDSDDLFYIASDYRSSRTSITSDTDGTLFSDVSCPQFAYQSEKIKNGTTNQYSRSHSGGSKSESGSRSHSGSLDSDNTYPHMNKPISRYHRGRFKSEPCLIESTIDEKTTSPKSASGKRRLNQAKARGRRSSAMSVVSPAGGQIEFGLFYDPDSRCLQITISQLIDLTLKPENFLPLLEVYEKDDRPKTNKVYLIKNGDENLELSDSSNMAFLVYVTLLPKRTFSRHTNVVFGSGNVVFNEKFSIVGYSTEQLTSFHLCFHALCKFGRDGEPIVLGEVKVPLKRIQVSQLLPFMANLGPPQEVLEVENYLKPSTDLGCLEVYLSYNPIGQKLLVKVIQARGLPKIGMTGHPNVSIKTSLYYDSTRLNKRTTVIKKRARDPAYNDSMEFDISTERLPECDVLFEIRHHGPMYRTVIGYVTVGASVVGGGDGEKQWKALLEFSYHEKSHKIVSHKPVALL